MAKKRYCRKCQNPIEEGKEIKISKGGNYSSSRYSSGPRDYYTYYLCPQCFEKQQEEIRAWREKTWRQVSQGLLIFSVVLILFFVLFLLYQYRRDKKIDKITKKALKK